MRKLLIGTIVTFAVLAACSAAQEQDSVFVPEAAEAGPSDDPDDPRSGDFAPAGDGETPDAGAATGGDAEANDCDANPALCLPPAVCGDGKAGLGESCDDGNTTPGDGCSATCQVEAAYWACGFGTACVDVRDCASLVDAGLSLGDAGCAGPPKETVCGDGILDPEEACDDHNIVGGDGCSLDCSQIEANFACPTPGAACVSTVLCGDGTVTGLEQCDDRNTKGGDGCSADCMVEAGWVCPVPGVACSAAACGDGLVAGAEECDDKNVVDGEGCSASCRLQPKIETTAASETAQGKTTVTHFVCPTPGAPCRPTECGDGVREGSEQCDDKNRTAFDGCSPSCELEPSCPSGKCVAVCGDGLLFDFDGDGDGAIDEECDDDNTRDGDGCSSTCKVERGFSCEAKVAAEPDTLDLPIVLRDFKYWKSTDAESHPDFEHFSCGGASTGLTTGVLSSPTVGSPWRVPVYARSDGLTGCAGQLTSAEDFGDWYTDRAVGGKQRGRRIDSVMLQLAKQPDGSYVFSSKDNQPYKKRGGFFPLDDYPAPATWGVQSHGHNYAFTTELRYWFTYDKNQSPQLTFSGDDDVWVFVNGKLALDLGGLHSELARSFTLDATKAAELGLVDENMYEVALFHAERHTTGSNFKLTLRGFAKKRSVCSEVCGDGIKTATEQCDDGANNRNDGRYGSCRTDCHLGPYCGDRVTTAPPEECDDGVNLTSRAPNASSSACGPGCKKPSYCGDGIIQGAYGERCDNGTANNTGEYGKCRADCSPGPRCGDGVVQADKGEQCDNGYNTASYVKHPVAGDCAPTCKRPRSCGDGVVDFPFEQCDGGQANSGGGEYGSCSLECTLGPRCGDGVVQADKGEQCDDGNRVNGDGCSASCTKEQNGPK